MIVIINILKVEKRKEANNNNTFKRRMNVGTTFANWAQGTSTRTIAWTIASQKDAPREKQKNKTK